MLLNIIATLLIVLAFYKGWTKGLIMSLFVLLSYFIATVLALHLSGKLAGYFKDSAGSDSKWYSFLAFVAIMLGGIIVVRLLGKLIEKAAEAIMLGLVNRIFGVLIYAFIYLSFLSIVLLYLRQFGVIEVDSTSKTQEYLLKLGDWTSKQYGKWLPEMKNLFNNSTEIIKQKADTVL
jgi:membrane protein required for colicin V production